MRDETARVHRGLGGARGAELWPPSNMRHLGLQGCERGLLPGRLVNRARDGTGSNFASFYLRRALPTWGDWNFQ